jgi:hypothetical protein
VSDDAVHQPTWSLLLKIEHTVKLQVFDEKRKTTPKWVTGFTSKLQGV